MVQTDGTFVLEVGSGIERVVSADVTRLANIQSLLRALYTHGWEFEKEKCRMSIPPFSCTRCQRMLVETGAIAQGCNTWISTVADLLI